MAESSDNAAAPASPAPTSPLRSTASPSAAPEPQAPADIEADDAASLAANAANIDDRISSYTASLTSSVTDYPTEYGRRFHAFRAGSYFGPNDEVELDRLDFNHTLIVKLISYGEKLFLAPVPQEKTHRILDIGTGTGIWAVEAAEIFPNAEILGNDLSAIQPAWCPPNVKFEIDDVESPWLYEHKFDFIFCRYMCAAIGDWPLLMKRAYKNLNPGGWVEFQDYNIKFLTDDDTLNEDHFASQWNKNLMEACNAAGRNPNPGYDLEKWVKEAGFVDVVVRKFKLPMGTWPKDPYFKDLGLTNLIQYLDGLDGFSLRAFCDVLGWTKEEVMVLLAHVRKEMKSAKLHIYNDFHVVYGRKPEAEPEAAS
ncbi:Secondary metabolism regulator LAE1 [Colletotrichum siamense]|nr:Secondary metabolism regulator LAE1 [Colletotrichum siamense]